MTKLTLAYVSTAIVFVGLDASYLAVVGPHLFRGVLAPLLAGSVRPVPAIAFYVLYVAGLIYFCVLPGLAQGLRKALISGAFLGLVAYGAYDLTCYGVMKVWSLDVTLSDMAWGAFASAVASALGVLAVSKVSARFK